VGLRSISDELSIGEPPGSTSSNYLAAKAEMEDAPASIGEEIRLLGTAGGAITSHYQEAWRLQAASGGTTPFPIRLPLPQGPICLLGLGAGLQMAKHP